MNLERSTNQLLAALPPKTLQELLIGAERVLLCEPRRTETHQRFAPGAYFPLQGMLAVEMILRSGATIEVGVVGREGVLMEFDRVGTTPANRVLVRCSGAALRLELRHLFDLCLRDAVLNQMIRQRWASSLGVVSQLVACNRHHRVEQQLTRWLLDYLDHDDVAEVHIAQERIAAALGVRREGVTEALGQLQHSGAIEVARCCVRIHDRAHLERLACECYPIIRDLRRLQTLAA